MKKDVNDLKRLKQSLKIGMPGQIRIDDEIALTGFVSECRPGYYQKEPCLTVKVNSEASRLVGASAGPRPLLYPTVFCFDCAGFD